MSNELNNNALGGGSLLLRRRAMMMKKAGILPAGFTELRRIIGNRSQQLTIPIGVTSDDLYFKARIMLDKTGDNTFLCNNHGLSPFFWNYIPNDRMQYLLLGKPSTSISSPVPPLNTAFECELKKVSDGYLYTQGEDSVSISFSPAAMLLTNLYVFGFSYQMSGSIYSLLFKYGGKEVNLVPCKNDLNAVGMYDTIGGVFYANTHSGTFGYETLDGTIVNPV